MRDLPSNFAITARLRLTYPWVLEEHKNPVRRRFRGLKGKCYVVYRAQNRNVFFIKAELGLVIDDYGYMGRVVDEK
jgi:hypothetical protein